MTPFWGSCLWPGVLLDWVLQWLSLLAIFIYWISCDEVWVVQFATISYYEHNLIKKMKNEAKLGLRGEQGGNGEMTHCHAELLLQIVFIFCTKEFLLK